ncbi:MAG: hypothetical protein ACOCVZ_03890 [Gemmatimonadota bacterium]
MNDNGEQRPAKKETEDLEREAPRTKPRPETDHDPAPGIEHEPEPDAENLIPRRQGPGTL